MKMLLIILLAQHAVISARAGLITYVRNLTVAVDTHIGEGNTVRGRLGSRFEAMLGPDAYLRMRDDAAVTMRSDALDNTVLEILDGAVIVEARKLYDDMSIEVVRDSAEFTIRKNGVYLFQPDRVTVLDGEMFVNDPAAGLEHHKLKKDSQLARQAPGMPFAVVEAGNVEEIENMPLVVWSDRRSSSLDPQPALRRLRPDVSRRFRF